MSITALLRAFKEVRGLSGGGIEPGTGIFGQILKSVQGAKRPLIGRRFGLFLFLQSGASAKKSGGRAVCRRTECAGCGAAVCGLRRRGLPTHGLLMRWLQMRGRRMRQMLCCASASSITLGAI